MSKSCIKCNINYDISFYEKGRNVCKSCRNLQIKANRNKNNIIIDYIDTNLIKTCSVCNLELKVCNFNKSKIIKDGYDSRCKSCYSKTRFKNKKIVIINNTITNKICIYCKENKEISCFNTTSKSLDGYFSICNNCIPPITWTKEKQKESYKKYEMNNKDKIREKWKRQSTNINKRVRDSLNHRISEALQTLNLTKRNTTFNYVGCSRDDLKIWFEFIFEDNMSWENYGEWHIDHVYPCSSFDLSKDDDKLKCFSWKNLRPCWSNENITKGNKILNDVINKHNKKVNEFINSTTKL